MNVWFRVDASSQIGVGHLMRCLALAQLLDEIGAEIVFFVNDETRAICLSRHDWIGKLKLIPTEVTEVDESNWLAEQEGFDSIRALILDGYQFSTEYRAALRKALHKVKSRLVLFDDTNNSGPLHADVIINSADNANLLNYMQTAPDAQLCLGASYRVLRREFSILPQHPFSMRNSLSIMMGGSDVNNLTIPILESLVESEFDGSVRVLTGAAYPHKEELESVIKHANLPIQHLHNCQQVAEVFCSSRLAVSAAGSSQFELLACATPSILLTVADNQVLATRSAVEQGWCQSIDLQEKMGLDALLVLVSDLWQDEQKLIEMSSKAKSLTQFNTLNEAALLTAVLGE
ncbi:UDP-2,4-diacetamido-2,4,6-trideoxy-beta-L-altropyranose hydrolase [Alteromonas sp. a30]|uniref:UDP-2,4-diacetamido-2,4, 6-trideoxy-beta-L-altropyranose hydrolase n=1 Tax=Alteromonas sp. a30 TaxID=2730917 RepID=UPI0022807B8C|nr:UDP-2,4-diacetamido-2,4,6-trideoxy-beta-L-altropyranose hydrolase [Alteromonas sp. a30]MCY7294526.1 UDP-2,4-diacetamido-2,4,6-trideoxy-beta-L-altropyranose hydrolase [Alteromonas sp. a30]